MYIHVLILFIYKEVYSWFKGKKKKKNLFLIVLLNVCKFTDSSNNILLNINIKIKKKTKLKKTIIKKIRIFFIY